ncbi:MAG: hypothetical protein LBR00_06385 [Clostridiales Family XIII bacterium]|jgi:trk system potassium uptake protein TrkH|nr:hypothetical protein [Clostridiales Family XIII bacterium]
MNLNLKLIWNILGIVMVIIGGTMLSGLVVALLYGEPRMTRIFLITMIVYMLLGYALYKKTKQPKQMIKTREGILSVFLCWVFAALLGTVPYMLSGAHETFIDAFFESMSCLTTTGSTLLTGVTELQHSLLFWRQFTTWMGGMGILIFAISILPMFGYGAANLASAETVGQNIEKVRARMTDTAKSVYLLYIALTVACIVLLRLGGTGLFDAFLLAFACLGNGGFGNYDIVQLTGDAISGAVYTQVIIIVFCILASFSFVNYQHLLKRRVREFFRDAETRLYLGFLIVVSALVVAALVASGIYQTLGDALRYGVFQAVGFLTTAGYAGADFDAWPQVTHWLMFIVMIVGGCSGSTSGGIKVIRAAVVFSLIKRNFYKRLHPSAVVPVRVGDKPIPSDRVNSIATFLMLYAMIVFIACTILSLEGLRVETTLGTVIAMLSNTGLVFGPEIGFADALQIFSPGSRFLMTILMLIGRLEIFTVLLLCTPAFWRPYK